MPFSNGCALVQTTYPIKNLTTFIIDMKRHQILSVPPAFKGVDNMRYNCLPILDYDSNKWGTYMINPETGEWSYDIPFIWDCLTLSRNEGKVYVGLEQQVCYSPNIDDTPYSHMIPDRDKVEVMSKFRTAGVPMTKQEAHDLNQFKQFWEARCCVFVFDPDQYWNDYPLYREKVNFCSTNDGTILEPEDLEDYALKKSYLKSR